jgi:hypothetical protein
VSVYAAMLRPRARLRPLAHVTALVLVLVAAGAAYAAFLAYRQAAVQALSNEKLRSLQAAVFQSPSLQDKELQRQWAVLRQERIFPWARVFRAVEHAADRDIELLEFRPDRRQGMLVLKGEGRTAESVMRYLERLQDDATFSRVYLVHTASVERGRLLTREFELRLNLGAP